MRRRLGRWQAADAPGSAESHWADVGPMVSVTFIDNSEGSMEDQDVYEAWYRAGLAKCCEESANKPGFVEQFNRLTGCHFGPDSSPDSADSQEFILFVQKYIWIAVVDSMWKAHQSESN